MKNNLFHVLPPLYVQNKNGSRDYKPIPHLNLNPFPPIFDLNLTFMHTTVCFLQGLPIDALLIMTLCALR